VNNAVEEIVNLIEEEARRRDIGVNDLPRALYAVLMEVSRTVGDLMGAVRQGDRARS